MSWHNINKYIIRKLVFGIGVAMAICLFTQNTLYDVTYIGSNPLMKVFTEEFFYDEVINTYKVWFAVIMLAGPLLILLTRKDYKEDYKTDVNAYNAAIAITALSIIAYVLASLFVLKVYSSDFLVCGGIALFLLILMVVNINYYKKHEDLLVDDGAKKSNIDSVVVACVFALIGAAVFFVRFDKIRDKSYDDFTYTCVAMARDAGFANYNDELIELDNYSYIYLQFVNMFNTEGKKYTLDELEAAIEDYENGGDQWYVLWDVCDMHQETDGYGSEIGRYELHAYVGFDDFGVDKSDKRLSFGLLVREELSRRGIKTEHATHEEIDEVCQYVYDLYHSGQPMTIIGDEPGEVKVTVEAADSMHEDDVKCTSEGEGYYASIGLWYEAPNVDDYIYYSYDDHVEQLESGKIYKTTIDLYGYMNYWMDEDMKIEVEGVNCSILKVQPSIYGGYHKEVDVWISFE